MNPGLRRLSNKGFFVGHQGKWQTRQVQLELHLSEYLMAHNTPD